MARARRKRRRRKEGWGAIALQWIIGAGVLALFFRGSAAEKLPAAHEEFIAAAWEYIGVESPDVLALADAARLTGDEVQVEEDTGGRRHWYRRAMFA
jgi:hypothetical protein